MADYIYMMESRLTPEQKRGVQLVQDVARAHGMNIYLVGGTVRDIISGANIHDLDFAVQGNALKLERDLEKAGAVVEGSDEHHRTLFVLMPGNLRGEITSARSEVYDKPGKPPEIAPATINEDLRRRDFTVNAMALSLNPGSRGLLLDPFNGVADIESKLIRVLHNYSFLEEPSRLIRATRFMARLDWTLEERTQARYDSAKENDYIEHVNRKLIGHEIEQVAHENEPLKVMKALEKEEWLEVLHAHWSVAKVDTSGLSHLLKIRQQMQDIGYTLDAGPAVMYFLTDKLNSADISALQSAIPRKAFVNSWKHLEDDAKDFAKQLTGKNAATNSQAWKMLSAAKPETILFTAATSKVSAAVKKINDFMTKWRQVRARFPLPEMAPLRITPELPEYPKLVEEMFMLMLDAKLKSQPEIIKFLTPYSPPEPEPPPQPARRGRVKKQVKGAKAEGGEGVKVKRGKKAKLAGENPGAAAAAPNPNEHAKNPAEPVEAHAPAKVNNKANNKTNSEKAAKVTPKSAPVAHKRVVNARNGRPAKKAAPPKKKLMAKKHKKKVKKKK